MFRCDIRDRGDFRIEILHSPLHETMGRDFDDGVRASFFSHATEKSLKFKRTYRRLLGGIEMLLVSYPECCSGDCPDLLPRLTQNMRRHLDCCRLPICPGD